MHKADKLISASASWQEFFEKITAISQGKDKGEPFERLTQLYLQTHPIYQSELDEVWLLKDVPETVRQSLNLPSIDEGIDLVARTRHNEYWAIQSKFRSNTNETLNRSQLGTFISLAFNTCRNISLAVVAHTLNKNIGKSHLYRNTVEIGNDRWVELDIKDSSGTSLWDCIRAKAQGKSIKLKPTTPRLHQIKAIEAAKKHFVSDDKNRGRLLMPCGTGKSLTAFWISQSVKASNIIVAVPSLSLIRQSLADWTREFLANDIIPDWLCVCSDETVGDLEEDEFVGDVYDTGLPTHTDPFEIESFLKSHTDKPKVIFTTYQSSKVLADAARSVGTIFDIAIFDEAHKTVGKSYKPFATLLDEKKISVRKRMFMTATEKVFRGNSSDVQSMDDSETIYGKRFYELSFKQAIEDKLICNYKVITKIISNKTIRDFISQNEFMKFDEEKLDEVTAQSIASGIAIKEAFKTYKVKRAVTFHKSIRNADTFREKLDALNNAVSIGPKTRNFHISSRMGTAQRVQLLNEFQNSGAAIITNARCLTEGVDIPSIDCVMFADPKQSQIDIIQATGRALRRSKDKDFGYIIMPLIVPDNVDLDAFAETTEFKNVSRVLAALSTQDERIAVEFRALENNSKSKSGVFEVSGDIPIGIKFDINQFANAISLKLWDNIGRANWRNFDDVRLFAQSLGLKSSTEWQNYCKSHKLPPDISPRPDYVYRNEGWVSWGDFLGTGNIAANLREYLPFEEARAFVHRLELKSLEEWNSYSKSGKKPDNIPATPSKTYKNHGWISAGDWLGTGVIASYNRVYRPFNEARSFAHSLKLNKISEWTAYYKTSERPEDIPTAPNVVYKDNGWISWGDWLGTGNIHPSKRLYRSFIEARTYVQTLNLARVEDWDVFCKSGNKPDDIPWHPNKTYAEQGWISFADWLGSSVVSSRNQLFLPFKEARDFVRSLGLKTVDEWHHYSKSEHRQNNIPSNPHRTYKNDGWISYTDWIGNGKLPQHLRVYRPFYEARKFVHALNLKSRVEWSNYCKSGNKPDDIPSIPEEKYKEAGWNGVGDWLGTGRKANFDRDYLPYNEAQEIVAKLNLTSKAEWDDYCKSGKLQNNIPKSPSGAYKNNGWNGWGQWLGTGRVANFNIEFRPFVEARKFVRALGLRDTRDWKRYCKSAEKPNDIPANPAQAYRDLGWISIGDWLGTGSVATFNKHWRSFEEAREFVRSLNLSSTTAWNSYCKSGDKPDDIPTNPDKSYAGKGWINMADWLGTNRLSNQNRTYRPFIEARDFARSLKLPNLQKWNEFCRSDMRPLDIPSKPERIYKDKGWKGVKDWLGN
jgi:superfamily II DNA or RNA helicase